MIGKESSYSHHSFSLNYIICKVTTMYVYLCFFQDHSLCYSNCHFTHTDHNVTLTFDFSVLGSVGLLMNGPSFTSKGTKYFHQFNISLCGGQVNRWKCANTCRTFFSKVCVYSIDRLCYLLCLYFRVSWRYAQIM